MHRPNVLRGCSHTLESCKVLVDTQKCPFYEVFQNMERTSPLRSSRRDDKKTYMEHLIRSPDEGVTSLERCSAIRTSDPSRDSRDC
jgi:hypothetical protein